MEQYTEHIMQDTSRDGGTERKARFIEAVNMIKDDRKVQALDWAYHKALAFDFEKDWDTYCVKNLVDELAASIIHVRDLLLDEAQQPTPHTGKD